MGRAVALKSEDKIKDSQNIMKYIKNKSST